MVPRSGLWLQSRTTYPDAWLPTLAAGPGRPCSRLSLESNRTPVVSQGNRWAMEGRGRSGWGGAEGTTGFGREPAALPPLPCLL